MGRPGCLRVQACNGHTDTEQTLGNKFGYLINAKAVGGEAADQTEFRTEFPKLSAGLQKEQDKFIARTA